MVVEIVHHTTTVGISCGQITPSPHQHGNHVGWGDNPLITHTWQACLVDRCLLKHYTTEMTIMTGQGHFDDRIIIKFTIKAVGLVHVLTWLNSWINV